MATKPLAPTAPGNSRELWKELSKSQQKGCYQDFPHSPKQDPAHWGCWGCHWRLRAKWRRERNENLSPNKPKYTRQQPSRPSPVQGLITTFCNLQPHFWRVSKSPPADPSQCTMAFNNCLWFSPGKPGKHPQFITRVTFRALGPQMIFTHFNLTPIQNRSAVSSLNSVAP